MHIHTCAPRSVTRLGDLLLFGQLFKAFGYIMLAQIAGPFLKTDDDNVSFFW